MIIRTFVAGIGALVLAAPPVFGQTPPAASPAISKPSAAAASLPGKWTCVSRASVEVAPVSYDTAGNAEAWVVVHRRKGEVVAAERIDRRELEKLRSMPCGDEGGIALVG